ncbi:MAG: sensor histidine kinase, partial [Planctomycetota bacterium]
MVQLDNDPETFEICTDTIVRHVADIGNMVDEFSSFARMPAPVMDEADLGEVIDQAVFLQRNAYPDITFTSERPNHTVPLNCDSHQIGRALTNLLQNSIDAIHQRQSGGSEDVPPGKVTISLAEGDGERSVVIEDNGVGLPREERERLTEPYVTTRSGGTGLGLAIVRKIMEDHGGTLQLEDVWKGGARAILVFPSPEDQSDLAPCGASGAAEGTP